MANKPIFFDATGRRAARVLYITWAIGILSAIIAIGFIANLLISQPTQNLDLPGKAVALNNVEAKAKEPGLLANAEKLATQALARRRRAIARRHRASLLSARMLPSILEPQKGRPLAVGFYIHWGESKAASLDSLKHGLNKLDWVVPDWITLDGPNLNFKSNIV